MNDFIEINHLICGGKPVIRGTRIMVRNILGMIAGGYTIEKIVEEYPELNVETIRSVLQYAAQVIDEEQVFAHA
jgi:uncharacterized protein (DUF433 family)